MYVLIYRHVLVCMLILYTTIIDLLALPIRTAATLRWESQLYSINFSNQSYALPLHRMKNIQFVHTGGVHLSLNITASVQLTSFLIHTGVSYAIYQQHRRQCFAISVNQALPYVGHVFGIRYTRSCTTSHIFLLNSGLFWSRKSAGINFDVLRFRKEKGWLLLTTTNFFRQTGGVAGHQKGKSPSKLATILSNKQKRTRSIVWRARRASINSCWKM